MPREIGRPTPVALLIALALGTATALGGCTVTGGVAHTKEEDPATKNREAARVNTELGQKYMQQNKLELALEKLQRALAFDNGYSDAHTVIAVLYERIGDAKQAEDHYRRAAEIKPKAGNELNNYGAFLCRVGKLDEAEKHFDRAIADPFYKTPEVALTNAGACLIKAGKFDLAERDLRAALDRAPNNGDALYQLASALYEKGDYFHARAFIQRFESTQTPRPESLMLARNIELKLGNGQAAQDYTRRLIDKFPDSEQARALNASVPS